MSFQELSFAPDRRSVQTTYYHFTERPSGEYDRRGFSPQDSLTWSLSKIYETKFPQVSKHLRDILVNILVSEVPLAHKNLTLLATANLIVYYMRLYKQEFTPQLFDQYFNALASILLPDMTAKKPEDIQQIRANFKATLLRYVLNVRNNTTDFTAQVVTAQQ